MLYNEGNEHKESRVFLWPIIRNTAAASCAFLNLWEALADDNGDLKAEYAQPDGIHIKPEGYPAWVEYLATHTVGQQTA